MSGSESFELIVRVEGERTLLCSPGVGLFSAALPTASLVSPGQSAGVLATLDRRMRLVVPQDVRGVIHSKPPDRLHAPVQYGELLYQVVALDVAHVDAVLPGAAHAQAGGELVLRSPQSGRFYHRSAPGDPALCEVGRELEVGTPTGLIEVMKTFTQVVYRAERGLPARAKILRVVAKDGADVDEGAVLLVVEAR